MGTDTSTLSPTQTHKLGEEGQGSGLMDEAAAAPFPAVAVVRRSPLEEARYFPGIS